jgi:uncharacterized protein YbbC (DUF1343 family)
MRALDYALLSLLILASCVHAKPISRMPPRAPEAAPEARVAVQAMPVEQSAPIPKLDAVDPFAAIDDAVNAAVGDGKLPGAVVVVGRRDRILLRRAYGSRALEPTRVTMTADTVFDLASLTKPIATATSILILADRGLLTVDDPVAKYLPDFGKNGKSNITLRHLLTHVSGLPADTPRRDYYAGRDEAIRRACNLTLKSPPGAQFVYSDIGFILLGEVVRRVSGQDLAAFSSAAIFAPLGMRETGFLPGDALKLRAAPTEQRDGVFMQGVVHDPLAYLLGGVAGHAGLFSTADDLSIFAQAMLGEGEVDGKRIFSASTWNALVSPHDVPGGIRTLGWDLKTGFSSNRGDSLSRRAIGHGGFTGTSLWIDPDKDLFVLFLSNRVHPNGKGSVNALAGRIGTIAGNALGPPAVVPLPIPCEKAADRVATGIDVLRAEGFERLRGAHVGLITNLSGRARDGTRTIDLLRDAPGVALVAIFTPEHGLHADREGVIEGDTDATSGLPVFSLYGESFAPSAESLAGIDTLVFDIQDVGTRFYTYASTMRRAMEAASANHLRFVVLDRPNPIDGVDVAGPILAVNSRSFVNHHPLPIRHGMTMGELAELFNADNHMGTRLQVVKMEGWRRSDFYDGTGIPWVNPSPNLRSVDEEILYPAVGLLEATKLSVGRGTETPFEVIGAPWIDGVVLAAALSTAALGGVSFSPTSFTPTTSVYRGERCGGVKLTITDRAHFEPVRTGLSIAMQLRALYPTWDFDHVDRLIACPKVMDAIRAGRSIPEIEALWTAELQAFQSKREKYLLYPSTCAR